MGENLKVEEGLMQSVQQLLEAEKRRYTILPPLTFPELRMEPIDFYQSAPAEYEWEGFGKVGGGIKINWGKNYSLVFGTFWQPATMLEQLSCLQAGNLPCPSGDVALFIGVRGLFPFE